MISRRERTHTARSRGLGALCAVACTLPFLACSDGGAVGPDGDADQQPGVTTFLVGNAGPTAAATVAPAARASVSGSTGQPPIRGDQIASLEIVVVQIDAHRSEGGGWVEFAIDPVTIDPATLDAGEVEVMASEDVPEGDYDKIRLIPESITVQFQTSSTTTPIVVGNFEYDPAPAEHDVEIPGGMDKGILVPTAHFSVGPNGDQILILWDADASAATIVATGSGKLLMRPVFVEADEEEEALLSQE